MFCSVLFIKEEFLLKRKEANLSNGEPIHFINVLIALRNHPEIFNDFFIWAVSDEKALLDIYAMRRHRSACAYGKSILVTQFFFRWTAKDQTDR